MRTRVNVSGPAVLSRITGFHRVGGLGGVRSCNVNVYIYLKCINNKTLK